MELSQPILSRTFSLLLLTAVSTVPSLCQTVRQTYQGHEAVANEVLIKFEQPAPNDQEAQANVSADITQAEVTADVDGVQTVGSAGWMLFHSPTNDVTTLMGLLTGAAGVARVEPNWIYSTTNTPNDPGFSLEWGMQNTGQTIGGEAGTPGADIRAYGAWDISTGSSRIAIGVLDTGIDYNHPDLAANVWSALYQFAFLQGSTQRTCGAGTHGWNTFAQICDPMDDTVESHGTHVSGIIGAVGNDGIGVAGVNWTTEIIAAKVCDASGSCPTSNIIDGIQFMEGAKFSFDGNGATEANIRVLNNSYGCGGCFSQALEDEISNAYTTDMLFVAAAGNSGSNNDTTPFYPASYSVANIISVAATDNRDNLASTAYNDGTNSNYGANSVHLGAPGVFVYSTAINDNYEYLSGTSMASPHVAGVAELSSGVCAGDTEWLKQDILNDVRPVPSLSGETVTGGVLEAYASVRSGSTACPGTGYADVSGYEQSRTVRINGQYVTVYDSGSVSLTVNGATKSVGYGQGSTAEGIAWSLWNQIYNDNTYPVRVHALLSPSLNSAFGHESFSAKTTGSGTCYSMSASYTYNHTYFYQPSFQIHPSGSALVGCK